MLITYDPEENVADKSLVPGIKELARLLVQVEDHIIIKSSLAQALDARYGELLVPETGFKMCQTWLDLEKSRRNLERQGVLMH